MATSRNKRKRTSLHHPLAHRVRHPREAHGWSQQELAAICGLHRTGVSLIERARCNVSLDSLACLADAFDVPVTDLLSPASTLPVAARLPPPFLFPNLPATPSAASPGSMPR